LPYAVSNREREDAQDEERGTTRAKKLVAGDRIPVNRELHEACVEGRCENRKQARGTEGRR
jgi:hypothetical protein